MKLQEYKVWDTTTRVFHWLNALCVLGLLAIGTIILNADALGVHNDGKVILKTTHVWIGYVFVLNLLWRLVWATPNGQAAFLFLLTADFSPRTAHPAWLHADALDGAPLHHHDVGPRWPMPSVSWENMTSADYL